MAIVSLENSSPTKKMFHYVFSVRSLAIAHHLNVAVAMSNEEEEEKEHSLEPVNL
jgi:hypothetical protein